jgi:hypothetical protein
VPGGASACGCSRSPSVSRSRKRALVVGLVVGLVGGGGAYFQHYVHRLFLTQSRALPWRAVLFLEEETGCILLQRVGGGYRFIHPLMQEHFASLNPSSAQTRGFSKAEKWVHESSVSCEGDNGHVLILSNRATKYTKNEHENCRKRWFVRTPAFYFKLNIICFVSLDTIWDSIEYSPFEKRSAVR